MNREVSDLYEIDTNSSDTKRELIPLKDIDVQKYIFDFRFISNNDEVSFKELNFYLELKHWTEDSLLIFCNFSSPLIISRGRLEDSIIIEVKNTNLFVAKDSHMKLKLDRRFI